MSQYQFGVVGLAVMGRGLALNLAEHGFSVAGYNLEPELTAAFTAEGQRLGFSVTGCPSYEALCSALEKPRKILIMVKAGKPVDYVLDGLLPYLEAGDVVIDGGNSHYPETQARQFRCQQSGIRFLGMGVSGGEEGARHGPALMPGGDPDAYRLAAPFLTAIAAHVGGDPCCAYIGPEGAGHYVKMVHNGIEYGMMQAFGEGFATMVKSDLIKDPAAVMTSWRDGSVVQSWLLDLLAIAFKSDPTLESMPPVANESGEAKWMIEAALELGVPTPSTAAALYARQTSRGGADDILRVVSTMRAQFGGHVTKIDEIATH